MWLSFCSSLIILKPKDIILAHNFLIVTEKILRKLFKPEG